MYFLFFCLCSFLSTVDLTQAIFRTHTTFESRKSPNAFGVDFPEAEIIRGKRKAASIARLEMVQNITLGEQIVAEGAEGVEGTEDRDRDGEMEVEEGEDECDEQFEANNLKDRHDKNNRDTNNSDNEDPLKTTRDDGDESTSRVSSRQSCRPVSAQSSRPTSLKSEKKSERKVDKKQKSKCVFPPSVYATIKAEDDANRVREQNSSFDRYLQGYTDNLHHPR